MSTHLIFFAAGVHVGILGFAVLVISGSRSRDMRIYRAGCSRGRSDLKAEMIADAIWHADNDRFGGTE